MAFWSKTFAANPTQWPGDFAHAAPWLGSLSPKAWLMVRVVLLVIWFGCWLACLIEWLVWPLTFASWCTKLTHWSATMELLYFLLATVATFQAVKVGTSTNREKQDASISSEVPWIATIVIIMQSIVGVLSTVVTLLYWTLVYSPGSDFTIVSVLVHGFSMVMMIVDILICRQTMKIRDIWAPLSFAAAYIIFSLIFFAAGGTDSEGNPYIYSALDWNYPGSALVVALGAVLVACPILYVVLLLLFSIRATYGAQRELASSAEEDVQDIKV